MENIDLGGNHFGFHNDVLPGSEAPVCRSGKVFRGAASALVSVEQ